MTPLVVTAKMASGVSLHPDRGIGLDSLLMSAAAVRSQQYRAIRCAADLEVVQIPIRMSDCGRYYLASFGSFQVDGYESRRVASPAPLREYRKRSDATSVDIGAGADKSFLVPVPVTLTRSVTWWCIGDRVEVMRLVSRIPGLGRRHGAGFGEVASWSVEECESWGLTFPVMLPDGTPTRPLPMDTPGLRGHVEGRLRLVPPYWMDDGAGAVAVREGGWS